MDKTKRRLLSQRKQDISVYLLADGRHLQVQAEMEDEVHRMRIEAKLTYPALRIKELAFHTPGVPDALCADARGLADTLVGQHAVPGLKWGGAKGKRGSCLLLQELFRATCTMLSYALSCVSREELGGLFPGISEEQLFKIWTHMRPDMKNTCLRYADDSPFMERVRRCSWPEGIERLGLEAIGRAGQEHPD